MERIKKLTFGSRYFWFTVLMATAFLFSKYSSGLLDYYQSGYGNCFSIYRFLKWELQLNLTADITLPAVLGIPFICWMYSEISEKRYYVSLVREKSRDVYAAKIVMYAVLTGMLAALMALFLSFVISAVHAAILLKGDITFGYMPDFGTETVPDLFLEFINNGFGWLGVLMRCISFAFYGGLFSVIGAVSVIWLKNLYVSAAMPFMVNLAVDFCLPYESVIPSWIFDPKVLMNSTWLDDTKGAGIFCMTAMVMGYCGIGYVLIKKGIGRLTR